MACLAELRKRISEDFKFVGVAIVDSLLVALFLGSAFFCVTSTQRHVCLEVRRKRVVLVLCKNDFQCLKAGDY